ncbi:MAG TPA: FKBP-type peptidyl-prolyl cis-trans isomerase [Opitutaceae bacterium]|jgi:FKBP-type peptidyl-prolyl cis-trans isomerase|nr:FKBP-type peptidyl-prolyl cis-trans isomerase [Opitutaceae bacterium]
MKLTSRLPVFLLGLGVAAALQAQEVKVNIPGQDGQAATSGSSQPAAAPAAAAQPAAPQYTDEQLVETMGWFLGKRSGLGDLTLTKEQQDAFVRGIQLAAAGKESPYDLQKIGPAIDAFVQKKQQDFLAKAKEQSTTEGAALFAKLKANKNVVELPDGLRYEIIKAGTGDFPKPTQTVQVNYTGLLTNGTVFDSSVQHGGPTEFQLDQVIPGWSEGIQKISKGGKIRLYVPPSLAYGDEARGNIPPAATLIFEVELLNIKDTPPAAPAAAPTGDSK